MTEVPDPAALRVGVYRHSRTGEHYYVLAVGRLDLDDPNWDDEPAVVYCRLYRRDGLPVSVRPLRTFMEEIEPGVPRFAYVGDHDTLRGV